MKNFCDIRNKYNARLNATIRTVIEEFEEESGVKVTSIYIESTNITSAGQVCEFYHEAFIGVDKR